MYYDYQPNPDHETFNLSICLGQVRDPRCLLPFVNVFVSV